MSESLIKPSENVSKEDAISAFKVAFLMFDHSTKMLEKLDLAMRPILEDEISEYEHLKDFLTGDAKEEFKIRVAYLDLIQKKRNS